MPRHEAPDPHSCMPNRPSAVLRTERNTLDLRGMSLSEAQDDCDMFFSTSIMDDIDGVYLLHGHGTGVLKAGIRRVRRPFRETFFHFGGPFPARKSPNTAVLGRLVLAEHPATTAGVGLLTHEQARGC